MKRVLACAALAVVLLAAPAAAQQYPPAVNSLTISDTTPTPGQTITIEGRTFAAGSTVTVTMESDPVTLGTAVADDQGVFTLQATIPIDTALGQHTITAAGQAPDGSALVLSATITVVQADGEGGAGDAGGDSSGALPRTGDDTSRPLAKLGLGLLVLGGLVTAVAAKRRKAAALHS